LSSDYKSEREEKVLELYKEGKTTRDIAKEQRLSLRDISHILKKHGVNHGITSIDDDNSKKTHSNNEKATRLTSNSLKEKSPYRWQLNLVLGKDR
jgi:DNA-binding NarL/FixJ family response regulator